MTATFQDINFKLCVIEELMYRQNLLIPKFDIFKFIENYKDRKIDIDEEGYEIIPEALEYFEKLDIPLELLTNISEMYQDGGNEIYMQICPFWDGENNQYNITNTKDVSLLPNLKKMTIFCDENNNTLEELLSQNIEAKYLY